MIGYHAVPVIVDAILKGLTTVNRGEALDAMKESALQDARGLTWLKPPETRGYIPADKEASRSRRRSSTPSTTGASRSWPRKLERQDDRRFFEARAGFYHNLFDPSTGSCGRASPTARGQSPFSPRESRREQARLHRGQRLAVHVVGDARRAGPDGADGRARRVRAEAGRAVRAAVGHRGRRRVRRTSRGSSASTPTGNEPSHHIAYLYAYAGAPWKTAARVRQDRVLALHDRARRALRQRGLRAVVGVVPLQRDGLLPGEPRRRHLRARRAAGRQAAIDLGGQRTFVIEADGPVADEPLREGRHAERQAARSLLDQPRRDRAPAARCASRWAPSPTGVGHLTRRGPAVDDEVSRSNR